MPLSIVAVHGLGANPAWAWIRKTEDEETGEERKINWLKDENMLPLDIPNARIMTFNYESKWIADAPKQGRFSCAEQLLTALDNQRREVSDPTLSSLLEANIEYAIGRK
jgi:hypothetical protein